MDQHTLTVSHIAAKVREFHQRKTPFRIYHGSTASTRPSEREKDKVVDVSALSNVLAFDHKRKTALVEPNVPMDELVKATMAEGLLPAVVMELPTITVGGGFAGMSGESSSFKYGLFDQTILSIELVLGNGDVILAADDDPETSELFYASAGSCGTLGVITLLEMQLVDAKPYVDLTYIPVSSVSEAMETLREAEADLTVDYMDGILYSSTIGVIMVGRLSEEPIPGRKPQTFSKASDPWLYLHAEQMAKQRKGELVPYKESIPTAEYLFRYDRGVFWSGFRAFEYFYMPFNRITRYLLDPFMKTRIMFHALHRSGLAWQGFIQDLGIPYSTAESFISFTEKRTGLWPLWLCPVKPGPPGRRSFAFGQKDMSEMLLDIGIWGFGPNDPYEALKLNREFEAKVDELGGVKVLYAQAYYTEEEFWRIYDEKGYRKLRNKYHAESLPTVYDKIKVDLKGIAESRMIEEERSWREQAVQQLWATWPFAGLYGVASAMKRLVLESDFVMKR